jgi:hypothetical protein
VQRESIQRLRSFVNEQTTGRKTVNGRLVTEGHFRSREVFEDEETWVHEIDLRGKLLAVRFGVLWFGPGVAAFCGKGTIQK